MKRTFVIMAASVLLAIFLCGNVYALDFGTEITISDNNYKTSGTSWYYDNEDQEVEPGMARSQGWDLEGFFLKENELTMIGGYDFVAGKHNLMSGDIFIDIDGDAVFGDIHSSAKGNFTVENTFGYDYVLDLDFSAKTYDVISLGENARTITSYEKLNQGSNPWRYADGGQTLFKDIAFNYMTGLTNDQTGFNGGAHNAVQVDLSFLAPGQDFTAHFTMECGNDNLMGRGVAPTPEPGTIFLLTAGLIGLIGIGRKRM